MRRSARIVTPGLVLPLAVNFTDITENGTPTSWNWSFGDGTFSEIQNPVHTYQEPGLFNVSLNASNAYSYDVAFKNGLISIGNQTIVSFAANATSGKAPLAVGFTDTSAGQPTVWNWSFGDGTYATTQNASHLYLVPGAYSVGLTASNNDGSNSTSQSNFITVNPPVLPVANFSVNATSGFAPLAVGFTDTTIGSPTVWNWSFGDGGYSDTQNPGHIYSAAGDYTVTLLANNADGSNSTTKVNYIIANPPVPPIAAFSSNASAGFSPLAVQFTDSSTNSPLSWAWKLHQCYRE